MADENFPGDESQTGSTLEGPEGPPKAAESEDESGETALLPKSLFGDVKPGQTLTVKVKRVFEEEVEVEPAECCKDDSEGEGGSGSPMDAAMGAMDRMGASA
jgi:hypothetical protein